MRRKREIAKKILYLALGAVAVVVSIQTFCSRESPQQNDAIHTPKQGNIRTEPSASSQAGFSVHPSSVQQIYDSIDGEDNHARCARYGWKYDEAQAAKPRRIFFGSLIADDSLDTIRIHATEAYGIYDTVAFVESNLTQTETARPLLYKQGSPRFNFITSGIFGSSTRVHVDYFLNQTLIVGNYTISNPMARERFQRGLIFQRWKENGMTADDIGIVADVDETFSRDVLRAVQVCDVPQFRPNQTCHLPRLTGETLIFESSPECMQRGRRWIHPDMIIGECIDGIGDASGHPEPGRQYFGLGMRNRGWGYKGANDYYRMKDNSTGKYPLWNIADIRELQGYEYIHWNETKKEDDSSTAAYATGFHFHNFFDELKTLRNKYLTYGHPNAHAFGVPISSMHDDIDLMVRCVKKLPNPNKTTLVRRFLGGFDRVQGPKPIYFQNKTYRLERHSTVRRMLIEDEKEHGSEYPQENKEFPQEDEDREVSIMHW